MSGDDPGQLARAAARRQLQRLRIQGVDEIDVEDIAADLDLFIVDGKLEGADGRTVSSDDGGGIIRIRSDILQPARRRSVIAHEIGHRVLHRSSGIAACTERDMFRYEEGNPEAEANWFAAELLLPGPFLRPMCNVSPSFESIEKIARICVTTLTATSIRFVQLTADRCALVWCEDERIKWVVSSPDFGGWIERGRKLNNFTHAHDAFRGKPLPENPQPVPQTAWLERRVPGGDLVEQTKAFARLGATLSLVWFPPTDVGDDDEDDNDIRWRR